MSHMAPWNIFDQTLYGQWGSSKDLRSHLEAIRPKVHLFGHIHENRGAWQRWSASKAYMGGVEYEPVPGKKFGSRPPPNATYPSDLIQNNAQMNNQFLDQTYTHWWGPVQIKAPGKLITAKWSGGQWHFSAVRCDSAASSGGYGRWNFDFPCAHSSSDARFILHFRSFRPYARCPVRTFVCNKIRTKRGGGGG